MARLWYASLLPLLYSLSPESLSRALKSLERQGLIVVGAGPVSYTHLTLPTNREV